MWFLKKKVQPFQTHQKRVGNEGERLAKDFLQKKGLQFVDQNYHSRYGEIDLIFKDGDEYVFIEVKTRNNDRFGLALESLTPQKIERVYKTAEMYLWEIKKSNDIPFRIDAVCIDFEAGKPCIEYIQNLEWED